MSKLELRGISEHNLKHLDLDIPHDMLVVVTGLSGSGKSTLAFDTVYAEGGRRYIETFSPYTRQFLDRLHPPALESAHNVRPALALEQRNRITSSRSTVGTVTEINDYLKLYWAQRAELHCASCEKVIQREPVDIVAGEMLRAISEQSYDYSILTFRVPLKGEASVESLKTTLLSEGHIRYLDERDRVVRLEELKSYPSGDSLRIIIDRIQCQNRDDQADLRARIRSSVAQAYLYGRGVMTAYFGSEQRFPLAERTFSEAFHCADCQLSYPAPRPSLFSFNSPLGACSECHGFGKVLRIDPELVVADRSKSIEDGAVHCWSTDATSHLKRRLVQFCAEAEIPIDLPWAKLNAAQKKLIFEGSKAHGYKGVEAWFARLEQKRHRMHVRVLLSRYRSEQECPKCQGSRLTDDALRYRVAGRSLPEVWNLSAEDLLAFFEPLRTEALEQDLSDSAIAEICSRLRYLCDIGLPYLTLDRQSRTLSGGESQRVNLTSLLGARLVHTMLVLDEPTIGLHPRDTARLLEVLQQLRNRGNSLLVVEHDPDVMRAADQLIDLGPDAGSRGGELLFQGSYQDLLSHPTSKTAAYLREPQQLHRSKKTRSSKKRLKLRNAHAHNLKGIDLEIPLEQLICITGPSGSGKSTLVHACLYAGYQELKRGLSKSELKRSARVSLDALEGLEQLDEIILIDQSPIGKSPRSNPATYTKAWDVIRDTLASTEAARQLGLSKSAFSFNVEGGRCPACKGAGQTKVEMQFLADVYVTCEVCNGSRFQESVLSVRFGGKNVIELLDTSIVDIITLFEQAAEEDISRKVRQHLQPLTALGLGYLRLGHPLSALSGGEAQRVKLASFLSERSTKRCLFILDEPTTGLHPHNIRDLLSTFDVLLERGHSVLCIEHNLDVIAHADWVIDLGPEGGVHGGTVLFEGKPQQLARQGKTATAEHLSRYLESIGPAATQAIPFRPRQDPSPSDIQIRGAREHNLREIDVSIPQNQVVAVTGVSGSGKSTLAFDILFAEGQRRYINCLSPYARQYIKQYAEADVDQVLHIPPTIAISQKTAPPMGISTVATTTEIYQYLRLLFAKAGEQRCIYDDTPITSRSPSSLVEQIRGAHEGKRVQLFAPVVSGRKGYYNELFNRALNAGISEAKIDGSIVSLTPDLRLERHKLHYISLAVASLTVSKKSIPLLQQAVEQCLILGNGVVELYREDLYCEPQVLSVDRVCPSCSRGYRELDPQDFSFRSARGVCERCGGRGVVERQKKGRATVRCPECEGARIAAIGRHVYFGGKTIHELAQMSAPELSSFLRALTISERLAPVVDPLLREVQARLRTITSIGLEYLSLDRDASSISGGEAQRLRLAKTLGSPLTGVCYVLDEPSIGLHSQDHAQLLRILHQLRDQGNTVVVVEHDEDTIRAADHVIDVGPGGGRDGGEIVFEGTVADLEDCSRSRTGQALRERQSPALAAADYDEVPGWIELEGAHCNNLKSVSVRLPLERFSVVCGVSGAGKSSLIHGTLIPAIVELMEGEKAREEFYDKTWDSLEGADTLERFFEIDQSPVGKTSASAPVSYLGIFDRIRKIYAQLPEAKARGWSASHFSFNTGKGRCPHCEGRGEIVIPMSFLPDATTPCEFCNSMRYNDETLEVEFQGVSIGALLKKTFTEAYELFSNHTMIQRSIEYVLELGLGYLSLGQATHTLSGGEAQRIKIARELGSREARATLYVLDEPTIGLHMTDVDRLRRVLQRLVDQGNTVVVIEHNLDIIRSADYLIELGPQPGDKGGNIIFQGSPQELAKQRKKTPTSVYLQNSTPPRQKEKASAYRSKRKRAGT